MFELLQYSFIQNGFIAGTFVAITAAVVGYFLLARGLTFAGHALSHIGFAGAAGAVLLGIDPLLGLLAFTIAAAVGIGVFGKELEERDITIGIILTAMLALGALFLSLYNGYAERAYSILFGTIVGISHTDVLVTAVLGFLTLGTTAILFRPLLFSSIDPTVAESRGVPVRFLSVIFLITVAVTVSIAVQVVGVLLIFTLLVGPAAAAMRLAHSPVSAIVVAILLGLGYTWIGILLAAITNLPVSFLIATLSFGLYIVVRLGIVSRLRNGLIERSSISNTTSRSA
jgi:zinc/manganese transport system permease protein